MSEGEFYKGLLIWIIYINSIYQSIWFNILSWFLCLELYLSIYCGYQYNMRPEIVWFRILFFMVFFVSTLNSIINFGIEILV